MYRSWIIAVLLLLPFGFAHSQSSPADRGYIGRAGDVYIPEEEFLHRFELTPGLYRHRLAQLDAEKEAFAYSMIAEKLLMQEAIANHLDADSLFQQSYLEARKLIARDELYQREIRGKVNVSPEEITHGMLRALKKPLLQFIYVPERNDAEFIRRQIRLAGKFNNLAIDSSFHALRDTVTVVWGDADSSIEEAAYHLAIGEVSPVVPAGDGFYILRLLQMGTNEFYSKMQTEVLKERVISQVRLRKERRRTKEFLISFMKGKSGYSPPHVFTQFGRRLQAIISNRLGEGQKGITSSVRGDLIDSSNMNLTDPLLVAGDRRWTVSDIINLLYTKGLAITKADAKRLPVILHDQFEEWVSQELLAQEGLGRRLDTTANAREQLETWREEMLATMMKGSLGRNVTMSDAEVYAYLHSKDTTFTLPQVKIQELRTSTVAEMEQALNDLQKGSSLGDVVLKYSSDPILRKKKGITEFFPITEHDPVGEIAWRMDVGQQFGPLNDSSGVVYFELLGKKSDALPKDTIALKGFEQVRNELLRMKRKRKLDLFLAQTGAKRGFEIYEERLRRLQVTATPMLAFKYLGFGGRMFAAPFVDKQLDWLNIEPPSTQVTP